MRHHSIARKLERYADGQLAPAEAAMMSSHLASCPLCRSRLAELRALEAVLGGYDIPGPSSDLSSRIMDAVRGSERETPGRARIGRGWVRWPAAAAAAAGAIALGLILGQAAGPSPERRPAEAVMVAGEGQPQAELLEAFGLLPEGQTLLEALDLTEIDEALR